MWELDEPNGRFGRWGQIGSAVMTFAILSFTIVFVLLDWIIGAPTWVLLVACLPIAVFSIAWGFTTVDDDDLAPVATPETESEEKLRWVYDKPHGASGWFLSLFRLWFGFGCLLAMSQLLIEDVLGLSSQTWVISGFPLLALALALEFLDLEEVPDSSAA